ncbi:MAG: ABC-F type ribosomal protection protein [Clostridiales bacterium]|nr:ABC-F type ribosomal protection protein [Clostridiales bacterium]
MASISASGVACRIGTTTILENITFTLEDGDRLGVVGVNGSGKSTLLKILSGEREPDEGDVFIGKNKSLGILHQDDAFNIIKTAGDTVIEQMYAAFPELLNAEKRISEIEREMQSETDTDKLTRLTAELDLKNSSYISGGGLYFRSKCRSMLTSLGFGEEFHSLPMSAMSGGQRTRIALARLLAREPDIMLLDEPTNHLDENTLEWLEDHLSSYKKTVIVVSHDRYFLDRVTNKTLDVENKTAHLYRCSYSKFTEEKKKAREVAEKKYELQQKEIARLEAYIENQRRWNRERNIIAAESREKAIARMEKVERPADEPKKVKFSISSSGESGNDVLELRSVGITFPGRVLFENLSFLLKKGERLFISGANGCGKSTLIRTLMGERSPSSGTIEFGYNVKIGYYAQENQNLDPQNTVLDELWNAYPGLTQTEIRNTLAIFMFRGDDIEKKVSVLSGGERARLTLAKLILSKMNLLILDEPTNHLDIASREALENALEAFEGTLIAVSHDRYFTRRLATRFVTLSEEKCTLYTGGYDSYRESLKTGGTLTDETTKAEDESAPVSSKDEYLRRKAEAARIRKAERRLEAIAKECDELEAQLVDIDDELFGEAAYDYKRAAELSDLKITVEDRLMSLYEEDEELRTELQRS